jgi:hypothetical protein
VNGLAAGARAQSDRPSWARRRRSVGPFRPHSNAPQRRIKNAWAPGSWARCDAPKWEEGQASSVRHMVRSVTVAHPAQISGGRLVIWGGETRKRENRVVADHSFSSTSSTSTAR